MSKIFDYDFRTGSNLDKVQGTYATPIVASSPYSQRFIKLSKGYATTLPENSNSTSKLACYNKATILSTKGTFIVWVYPVKMNQNTAACLFYCGSSFIAQLYYNNLFYYQFCGTSDNITIKNGDPLCIVMTFNSLTLKNLIYVNGVLTKTTTNAGASQCISHQSLNIIYGNIINKNKLFRYASYNHILTQKEINADYKQFLNSKPMQKTTVFP